MKSYNRVFAAVMLALALALTACSESSTTPNNSQEGEKSSSSQNSLSSGELSSGENGSSAGETSSLALSSFDNGLERCADPCVRGTTYPIDGRCSRSLHNWTAIVENNQLPSEEYTTLWRDDGKCNLIRD